MQRISACIVVYNGAQEAIQAAASVLKYTQNAQLDLYLVDNASPDGSAEQLKQAVQDGQLVAGTHQTIEIICSEKNLGFGGGHNLVLPKLTSAFHFILNPDILITSDVLSDMADYALQYPEVVMARPALTFPDGTPQVLPLRRCTVGAILYRQLPQLAFLKPFHDTYVMEGNDLSKPTEISFCTGSFSMMRTQTFRMIGGFDEGYFMYVEDADLTQKALQVGKVWLLPQFSAIHAWHRAPHSDASHFTLQARSMLRYFRKWGFWH